MAKKYYVVWAGRETGVFDNWPYTKSLVDGFTGARYKSFPSKAEAEAAFAGGGRAPVKRKATTSKASTAKPKVDPSQYDVQI